MQNSVPNGVSELAPVSIRELLDFDERHVMFRHAVRFVDYELVPGDIVEFGVYTGRSLALLAHFHQENRRGIHKVDLTRKVIGLDSFMGLPGTDNHPRWKVGMFGRNHSFHPILEQGASVTPEVAPELFRRYGLPEPVIIAGPFHQTIPGKLTDTTTRIAVAHVDCDVYLSTISVLTGIDELIGEGSILLFDDWFNFLGKPDFGEQRAFWEYSASTKRWAFAQYQTYATFGNSFIVHAKT